MSRWCPKAEAWCGRGCGIESCALRADAETPPEDAEERFHDDDEEGEHLPPGGGSWDGEGESQIPEDGRTPAEVARDEAIERVDGAAPVLWKDHALDVVGRVCGSHETFTTDDVWTRLDWKPPERRAISPVLLRAAKMGLCVATGEYRKSLSVECHARPKLVWRSLVAVPARP